MSAHSLSLSSPPTQRAGATGRAPAGHTVSVLPAVAVLPSRPGVYRFRDTAGRAMYIGRAADLRARVASYWGDLADRRHLRRMVPQIARVEAVPCASRHEAAWLERNLLERSKPRWNRVRGGLEVPAYVRLERRAGAARLRVVHSPEAPATDLVFGPYLGGTRSRLAVALAVFLAVQLSQEARGILVWVPAARPAAAPGYPPPVPTAEAVRLAADPTTQPAVLADLAARVPETWVHLARNPATYPDLLAWLAALGRPDVTAALEERAG